MRYRCHSIVRELRGMTLTVFPQYLALRPGSGGVPVGSPSHRLLCRLSTGQSLDLLQCSRVPSVVSLNLTAASLDTRGRWFVGMNLDTAVMSHTNDIAE